MLLDPIFGLFQHGKPGPQGQVRDRGLCLRVLRLGVLEYWSIEKIISGCEVFHKPSLYNASIRDQVVLPPLQHSITP